jgi:putative SOS response-associated peptidase YedK
MCGRFTDRYSWRELKELYDITTPYLESNFPPRTNIAPTQNSFVVRRDKQGGRELVEMKWGLVPSWSKDGKIPGLTINAKAESASVKPAFRAAYKARPCLVVADGFYEWQKRDANEKQPFFITRKDNKPFAFAGLWEAWRAKDAAAGSPLMLTFTIMTCEPNALCARVHNRMPVMLAPEHWPGWLGTPEKRDALMKPFPADDMTMWPVSKAVGSVKNTGAELVERVELSA